MQTNWQLIQNVFDGLLIFEQYGTTRYFLYRGMMVIEYKRKISCQLTRRC